MWKVHGGYALHAASCGAQPVVGVDLMAATTEFVARNAAAGDPVRFVQADVNDSTLPSRIGDFDVVFCSGVLYHVPSPIQTLEQLRKVCRRTLILATASAGEADVPHAAVFLPFMEPAARARFAFWTPHGGRGATADFTAANGYGNWFWLPTPSCLRAMLRCAGFDVVRTDVHRRVTTIVATAVGGGAAAVAPTASN